MLGMKSSHRNSKIEIRKFTGFGCGLAALWSPCAVSIFTFQFKLFIFSIRTQISLPWFTVYLKAGDTEIITEFRVNRNAGNHRYLTVKMSLYILHHRNQVVIDPLHEKSSCIYYIRLVIFFGTGFQIGQ